MQEQMGKNYITTPLELLYNGKVMLGIIAYKGSNPIDYYPENLEIPEILNFLNLFVTDRLYPLKDLLILRMSESYILIMPTSDYKTLTIIFKPNIPLSIVQKYYTWILKIFDKFIGEKNFRYTNTIL